VSAGAGSDGANVTTTEAKAGLDLLATQTVNIVTVAGMDAKTVGATLLAHLEATENDGRERIAVVGASSDDVSKIGTDDANALSNPRVILVAPGILSDDAARTEANKQVKLPAAYSAALLTGRLSTLAPHISLTNKDVAADGLTDEYTRAEQKQLLNNRVLVLQKNLGIRVLKGITTDTGAFRQISVRRIVDYAKAGVRIGSNPYIGRLNNSVCERRSRPRWLPLGKGARRDADWLPTRRHGDSLRGDQRHRAGHDDAAADVLDRLCQSDHDAFLNCARHERSFGHANDCVSRIGRNHFSGDGSRAGRRQGQRRQRGDSLCRSDASPATVRVTNEVKPFHELAAFATDLRPGTSTSTAPSTGPHQRRAVEVYAPASARFAAGGDVCRPSSTCRSVWRILSGRADSTS
jgi:hypothetical protein